MTGGQGPSGPAEREVEGPSGPAEREVEGPSGPAEREVQPPDLSGPEADQLLRTAAELAIEMAQAGVRTQPPIDAPSRLRPLLAHAKVTRAALATARRVVEEDPGFRARVATALAVAGAEAAVGRAGVLWLSRPEGWEAELGALVAQAREARAARDEGAEERTAQRRLRHAEEARDRAERAAETARRAAEAARAELQEERRLRREADERGERMARRASAYEEQLAAARRAGEAAADQLAARTDAEAGAVAALAAAEAELQVLRAEAAQRRAVDAERPPDVDAAVPSPAGVLTELDRRAIAEAVRAASAAAADLGSALGRAAAALGPGAGPEAARPDEVEVRRPSGPSATPPRWARSRPRGRRRRQAPLPPLVRDDSPEAADHLVSLPRVALLVDGYNATLSTWPDLPLPEQRLRLIDALAELAARTGARPEVVFDGVEAANGRAAAGPARSLVKVSFTAADVEADDVLIARAHALPLPVVVASDDHRVRDGAREAGANVLTIDQLLAALRRSS